MRNNKQIQFDDSLVRSKIECRLFCHFFHALIVVLRLNLNACAHLGNTSTIPL